LDALVAEQTLVVVEGGFVARPHQPTTLVRGAAEGVDRSVRRAAEIPGPELEAALEQLVADSHRTTEDDLTSGVARIFGWSRRGPDVAAVLGRALANLV